MGHGRSAQLRGLALLNCSRHLVIPPEPRITVSGLRKNYSRCIEFRTIHVKAFASDLPCMRRTALSRSCSSPIKCTLMFTRTVHSPFRVLSNASTSAPLLVRHRRPFVESQTRKARTVSMSSDADYAAFLEKANQDTGDYSTQSKSKSVGTRAVNTEVPKSLQDVDEVYVSEADEPFEPVSLKWSGEGIPSADELKDLLSHGAEVSKVDEKDFDGYQKVIKLVKDAGNGSVGIYRVHHGKTRAEYYIVSVDAKGAKVVGLKALAVET